MDQCPKCNNRLIAVTDRTGRTEMRCLKCDKVDPMKTDAVKWANSPLSGPTG
jgi:DNA-directed RNA polymerase subunit M/transcription elongation factor TFIIS